MNNLIQGNKLIEASYKLSLDEMRLLNLALLKVDNRKSHKEGVAYSITIKEFRDMYGIARSAVHSKIKLAAKGLMCKPITIYSKCKKTGSLKATESHWFSELRYDVYSDVAPISLVFSELVRSHIYELTKDFTQVNFNYVVALNTAFSIRLYLWLSYAKNRYDHDDGLAKSITLNVNEMKLRAGLMGKYKDYRNFKIKCIEPAILRINNSTDLSVAFEPIRSSRLITDIKFTFLIEKITTNQEKLPLRPQVLSGSHEEGVWARKCIEILNRKFELLNGSNQLIPLCDLNKMYRFLRIIGDTFLIKSIECQIKNRK